MPKLRRAPLVFVYKDAGRFTSEASENRIGNLDRAFRHSPQQSLTPTRQVLQQELQRFQSLSQHRQRWNILCIETVSRIANSGAGQTRSLLQRNAATLGLHASLSEHQTLCRRLSTHENRPDPRANPTRPSRCNRRDRQKRQRRQQPRQNAEQSKPLCLYCPFQVHVVCCLSFKSVATPKTKHEQMSTAN